MKITARTSLTRIGLSALLALGVSVSLTRSDTRAQVEQEMMEDMCSGEMQWMVGWCIDMMMSSDMHSEEAMVAALSTAHVGVFNSIDVPDARATRAFGNNPQGDIVGSYTNATGTHGFLLRDGVFTTIDVPGASATEAWGINARGDIIGRYTRTGRPGTLGFLLSHGRFQDISIPSATGADGKHLVTLPTKIGASGEIVGCYHDINGFVDMFGYVQRGQSIETFTIPRRSVQHLPCTTASHPEARPSSV